MAKFLLELSYQNIVMYVQLSLDIMLALFMI